MARRRVLALQLTGGEPLIDPLFAETHARASDIGMMIQISSNGSRLERVERSISLTTRRPYRLTLNAGITHFHATRTARRPSADRA